MLGKVEPKFISPADFFNYWGVDLDSEFGNKSDNISNASNIFLKIVEDRVMSWIDANTFRNVDWDELSDYSLEKFKIALLTQAMYMFRNTDIAMDSGYDPDSGIVISRAVSNEIIMSEATLNLLREAGLFNQVINNHQRYIRFR